MSGELFPSPSRIEPEWQNDQSRSRGLILALKFDPAGGGENKFKSFYFAESSRVDIADIYVCISICTKQRTTSLFLLGENKLSLFQMQYVFFIMKTIQEGVLSESATPTYRLWQTCILKKKSVFEGRKRRCASASMLEDWSLGFVKDWERTNVPIVPIWFYYTFSFRKVNIWNWICHFYWMFCGQDQYKYCAILNIQ